MIKCLYMKCLYKWQGDKIGQLVEAGCPPRWANRDQRREDGLCPQSSDTSPQVPYAQLKPQPHNTQIILHGKELMTSQRIHSSPKPTDQKKPWPGLKFSIIC